MSAVYAAIDTVTGEFVALKRPPPDCRDPELSVCIQCEGLALALIADDRIVALRDRSQSAEGVPFIALELMRGRTWADELRARCASVARTAFVAAELCTALDVVHRAGIVHRDVKTENVFVLEGARRIKLFDFGSAKLPSGDAPWMPEHLTIGTASSMAPEQCTSADVDWRADIFSLGVSMYEALTGERPFERQDSVQSMYAVLDDMPQWRLRKLRPRLARPLRDVLEAMLEKDPRDRPSGALEIRAVLEPFARSPRTC